MKKILLGIILVLLLVLPANAAVIFQENFDSWPVPWNYSQSFPSPWQMEGADQSATLGGVFHHAAEVTTGGRTGNSYKFWCNGSFPHPAGYHLFLYNFTGSYKDLYTRWYMKIPSALTSNYADYLKLWRFRYSDSTGGQAVLDFRYGAFPGIINIFLVTGTGHQPTGPLFTPSVDGQWHCYEVRMKLNSAAGVYDGAMQGWKDGTLTYSDTAVNWDATSTSVFISTGLGIGNRADNVVFQNSWQAIEMDDYVLSTTYVGPGVLSTSYGGPAVDTIPPNRPQGLKIVQ
jgi:hypothetical protein